MGFCSAAFAFPTKSSATVVSGNSTKSTIQASTTIIDHPLNVGVASNDLSVVSSRNNNDNRAVLENSENNHEAEDSGERNLSKDLADSVSVREKESTSGRDNPVEVDTVEVTRPSLSLPSVRSKTDKKYKDVSRASEGSSKTMRTCFHCNERVPKEEFTQHIITKHRFGSISVKKEPATEDDEDFITNIPKPKGRSSQKILMFEKCQYCNRSIATRKMKKHLKIAHKVESTSSFYSTDMDQNDGEDLLQKGKKSSKLMKKKAENSSNGKMDGSRTKFKCKLCKTTYFKSRRGLYKHYSIHHFKQEIKKHVTNDSLICKFCGEMHVTMSDIIGHIGVDHLKIEEVLPKELHEKVTDKTVSFGLEGRGSKKKEPLKKFSCGLCDQKYASRALLYRHYSNSHYRDQLKALLGDDPKTCTICEVPKEFSDIITHLGCHHLKIEDYLPAHLHLPRQGPIPHSKFTCQLCQAEFTSKLKFHSHCTHVHFKDQMLPFIDKDTFTCKICGRKMSKLRVVLGHVGTAHNKVDQFLSELKSDANTANTGHGHHQSPVLGEGGEGVMPNIDGGQPDANINLVTNCGSSIDEANKKNVKEVENENDVLTKKMNFDNFEDLFLSDED